MPDLQDPVRDPKPGSGVRDAVSGDMIVGICSNASCRYYEVPRLIRRKEVGEGIFLKQAFVCICGHDIWIAPRRER